MKDFKGTPGPWHVQFGDEIYAGDSVDNEQVATANDCHDADLISAAPELLFAVNLILELQLRGFITLGDKHTGTLSSAIAKALGE